MRTAFSLFLLFVAGPVFVWLAFTVPEARYWDLYLAVGALLWVWGLLGLALLFEERAAEPPRAKPAQANSRERARYVELCDLIDEGRHWVYMDPANTRRELAALESERAELARKFGWN